MFRIFAVLAAFLAAGKVLAAEGAQVFETPSAAAEGPALICGLIEREADIHGLPAPYLARLIWTESRFDVKALSPAGAQGVAQFMPTTAKLRGLRDPWNPHEAIPAAAAYLAEMRDGFGDLGRAAAAYNAGEDRVARWLAGASGLPSETRAYVRQITFEEAEAFRAAPRALTTRPLEEGRPFIHACRDLPVIATRALGRGRDPWAAQIAGAASRKAAWGAWRRLKRIHHAALSGVSPQITRNAHRRNGAIWQVRIGASSRAEASRICARLRASGGACATARN